MANHPLNQDFIGSEKSAPSLPDEIWNQIFISAGDVLLHTGNDALYFDEAKGRNVNIVDFLTRRDWKPSIMTRKAIVLVCQRWHRIGIPMLYYQLVMKSGSISDLSKLDNALSSMGQYVRQLILSAPDDVQGPLQGVEKTIQNILNNCISLHTFIGFNTPLHLSLPPSTTIISIDRPLIAHNSLSRAKDIKYLGLSSNLNANRRFLSGVDLSHLMTLSISGLRRRRVYYPLSPSENYDWEAPNLRRLTISNVTLEVLGYFHSMVRDTITELQISSIHDSEMTSETLSLPHVVLLTFGEDLDRPNDELLPKTIEILVNLRHRLELPKLNRIQLLGQYEPEHKEWVIGHCLLQLMYWIPSVSSLRLVELPSYPFDGAYHYRSNFAVRRLNAAGVMVKSWNDLEKRYESIQVVD